jgi:hypothetical protein
MSKTSENENNHDATDLTGLKWMKPRIKSALASNQ